MNPNTAIAYKRIMDEGLLPKRQIEAYELIYLHGPITRNELDQKAMHGTVNPSYSRRLKELEDRGVIYRASKRKCTITGHQCDAWAVTSNLPVKPVPKESEKDRLRRYLQAWVDLNILHCGCGHQGTCLLCQTRAAL